jgi:uncharacterized protein (TIGR03067 family)
VKQFVCWSVMIVCLASATTLVAQDDSLKRMRGHWEVIELVEDGKVIPKSAIPEWLPSGGQLEIEDNAIVIRSHVDDKKHVRIFSTDATQYPPTLTITDTSKAETHGIYKFDDNRLVVCLSDTGDKAPTEFSAKEGSGRILMVLQSTKGAPAKPAAKPAVEKTAKVEEIPAATTLTDGDVTKLLDGVWRYDDSHGALFVKFRPNGTFSTTREFQELRLFQKVFVQSPASSGTWKVERGTIKCHITSSIYPERVGNTFGFAVRSMSATDFIFIDYLGRTGRAKKL